MSRKVFAAALFALGCTVMLCADAVAVEEAPPPREVVGKKPEGNGKFGGFGGKLDPEKFKQMKGKFGKDGFRGKGGFPFPGGGVKGRGGEKGKGGFPFPGGKGAFPGGGKGGFDKGKKKGDKE